MGDKKTVRIVETSTGEVVETLELSERGLDGLYQRIDFDRFHTSTDDDDQRVWDPATGRYVEGDED